MDLFEAAQQCEKLFGSVENPRIENDSLVADLKLNAEGVKAICRIQEREEKDDIGLHDIRVRAFLNQGHKKERESLEVLARRYRDENPKVWEMFCRFAWELKEAGHAHAGVALIFERMRWETMISGNDGFKINNNYRAYFARWLMEERSEFSDFFSTRETTKERNERLASPS